MSSHHEIPRADARAPFIVDVDTGLDDALALFYLARCDLVELRAVTCVAGNTSVDRVLRNTLGVLDAAGAGPDVPVAVGAEQPLVNPPRPADGFHGSNGLGGVEVVASSREADARSAIELMRDTVEASDVPVTLLALGPLTNVALFIRVFPRTARKLGRIVFMGGAIATGNATPVAEFNAWHDPEALDIVLRSDIPTTMFGLDIFLETVLSADEVVTLSDAEAVGSPVLSQILDAYGAAADGVHILGDAGAACVATVPSLSTIATLKVHVELGGSGRGQTIVDRRAVPGEAEHHALAATHSLIDVVTAIDAPAMARTYVDTVTGARGFASTRM